MARQSGHLNVAIIHVQRLHAKPSQLAEAQIGFCIADHRRSQIPHLNEVGRAEQLFGDGLQKFLLHFNAADISLGVTAFHSWVVLAEPHQLNGLFAVQMLHPRLQKDMQILGGVVPHHVGGHIEIHAANQINQLFKALEADHHISVDGNAQQHFQLSLQLFGAAAETAVDFFDFPLDVGHRVPRDIDHIHLLSLHIVRSYDDRVRPGPVVVRAAQHEGKIVLFALLVPLFNKGLHQVGKRVFLLVVVFFSVNLSLVRLFLRRHVRRFGIQLDKTIDAQQKAQQHAYNNQGDLPSFSLFLSASRLSAGFCLQAGWP